MVPSALESKVNNLSGWVVDVLPEPVVTWDPAADKVQVRRERMEALAAVRVPRVAGRDAHRRQTLSDFDVFDPVHCPPTEPGVRKSSEYKPVQGLSAEDVPGATAHVALSDVRPEPAAKVDCITWAVLLQ